ncbi:MAG: hypothetical protein QM775_17780 [Pirellulales bacterium]
MSLDSSSTDVATTSGPAAEVAPPKVRRSGNEPVLIPVLGPHWALHWKHLLVVAAFGTLAVFLNHIPLRGTDLWGHLEWGKRIIAEQKLPTEDPLQPLAAGMRVVDLGWLSQVIYAGVEQIGGPEGLISLFTAVILLTYLLVARTCYLQTRSAVLSTVLTAAAVALGWSRISTIRPENFALLLFASLLWLLIGRRVRRDDSILADDTHGDWKLWLAIPVILALWANLHGSFFCGLGLLGCFVAGRACEVLQQQRSVKAVFVDREFRRLVYWTELAALAVLVNPYTIDAYIEAVRFSRNLNLRDVVEWAPLSFGHPAGLEFAAALVVVGLLLRHSLRKFAASDVFALLLFGAAAALQLRMIGWFAILWAVSMAPHLADVLSQWFPAKARGAEAPEATTAGDEEEDEVPPLPAGHSYRYTLGCAGLIWIAFAFTTFARPLLGGQPRTADALFGEQSPQKVVAWLHKNPPTGQVFNPQYWGDWLAWAGPKPLQLFVTTNMHLTPRSVWQDYGRIAATQAGWETVLDRYRVQTVIVDRQLQPNLGRALRTSADWSFVYEDDQAQVFRRKPKAAAAGKADAAAKPAAH